ncbi:MAG TPA: hypothetical protein VJ717_09730 [Gemmatimonadaceae bacterium]|nr:hypothetical protein [Gemmatimonadaceae bacterium]
MPADFRSGVGSALRERPMGASPAAITLIAAGVMSWARGVPQGTAHVVSQHIWR